MIHNDFVMLIRSSTAWLYSFLFHIHRIASARTAFDWQICTKETSKANKKVIFGYEFRELSAFTNVGFPSTQALITLGNKHNLATVLPPKLRPGKFTSKSPLEVETAMWYDLQAQNWNVFLSRNGVSWQSLRIRNLKAGEICSYFPRNLHQKMSEPGSACSAQLCKSPWMSYYSIYCMVFGVTLIWTNPIARQRLGYRFGNILHWLEFLHRRLVKTLLNNTFLGLKNLTAIGMPRSKVVFILVQLFVANLRDEVVGNSIDAFPLRMASLGKWIDVDSNLSVLAICSSKNWHGELVMLVMVTKLGWSSRPLLRCYTEVV